MVTDPSICGQPNFSCMLFVIYSCVLYIFRGVPDSEFTNLIRQVLAIINFFSPYFVFA